MEETDAARLAREAREQEAGAVALAEQRGREAAKIESHLEHHDRQLTIINGSIARSAAGLEAVSDRLTTIESLWKANEARATGRDEALAKIASAQVSTRTFVMGLVGLTLTLGALLITTLAATGAL